MPMYGRKVLKIAHVSRMLNAFECRGSMSHLPCSKGVAHCFTMPCPHAKQIRGSGRKQHTRPRIMPGQPIFCDPLGKAYKGVQHKKVSECKGTQSMVPCPKGPPHAFAKACQWVRHISVWSANRGSALGAYVGCNLASEMCKSLVVFINNENLFCWAMSPLP